MLQDASEDWIRRRLVEDDVGRFDAARRSAVVVVEYDLLPAPRDDLVAGSNISEHVRASKAVDRLLGVADEIEHAAALGLLEEAPAEDRPLRLVGVLELVDEHVAPAIAHRRDERVRPRA